MDHYKRLRSDDAKFNASATLGKRLHSGPCSSGETAMKTIRVIEKITEEDEKGIKTAPAAPISVRLKTSETSDGLNAQNRKAAEGISEYVAVSDTLREMRSLFAAGNITINNMHLNLQSK